MAEDKEGANGGNISHSRKRILRLRSLLFSELFHPIHSYVTSYFVFMLFVRTASLLPRRLILLSRYFSIACLSMPGAASHNTTLDRGEIGPG